MQRIDDNGASTAAVHPGYDADAAPAYFTKSGATGTYPNPDWTNMIQEELCNLIDTSPWVAEYGNALDGTVDTQLSSAVESYCGAMISHAADTTALDTLLQNALIASTTSRADGPAAVCVASAACRSSGTTSACLATNGAIASGQASAVIASWDACTASAVDSAVIACDASTASNTQSIVLASDTGVASGAGSAVIA